jgi:hypothetical protein
LNLSSRIVITLGLAVWASAALAQTMIGLPGVQLSGSSQNPQVTNLTGKTIACLVIVSEGSDTAFPAIVIGWPSPIASDQVPHGLQMNVVPGASIPDKTYIDGYVFTDGTFVGPDKSDSFSSVGKELAAFASAGAAYLSDRVAALSQFQNTLAHPPTPAPAPDLRTRREHSSEAFAQDMAARLLLSADAYPGKESASAMASRFAALGTLHR